MPERLSQRYPKPNTFGLSHKAAVVVLHVPLLHVVSGIICPEEATKSRWFSDAVTWYPKAEPLETVSVLVRVEAMVGLNEPKSMLV